ncbi:MAG: hypothetical protein RJA70_4765, partial [Pseudomonadota bacterium]
MSDSLRAAAVQLQSGPNVAENLIEVSRWVWRAAELGARLVLLPENFAFFGDEATKRELAEDLQSGGPISECLARLAGELKITVIGGGFPERGPDPARPYNTSAVFTPEGTLGAYYRKVHLFDVDLPGGQTLRESDATSSGNRVVVTEVEGFRVGLSICYDLRFSELYKALSEQGAEVLTLPAAFTEQTGMAHWHVLLRARAIEWQCFVLAAGQWGQHGARRTFGHSLIVDPWGT